MSIIDTMNITQDQLAFLKEPLDILFGLLHDGSPGLFSTPKFSKNGNPSVPISFESVYYYLS